MRCWVAVGVQNFPFDKIGRIDVHLLSSIILYDYEAVIKEFGPRLNSK